MSLRVIQVFEKEWKEKFSAEIHKVVFREIKPASLDRISYALLVVTDESVIGYVTVRELDSENVYWQFGGVLTEYRKSLKAIKVMESLLHWQKKVSRRIAMYVENTNLPMLRLALAYGFLVVGTRTFEGHLMVDLIKDFQK